MSEYMPAVEAVAEAICNEAQHRFNYIKPWDDSGPEARAEWVAIAKAAIEAAIPYCYCGRCDSTAIECSE